MRGSRSLALLAWFMVLGCMACGVGCDKDVSVKHYTIPFRDGLEHPGLYEGMDYSDLTSDSVREILVVAKDVARKVGYLTVQNGQCVYGYEGEEYRIEAVVMENERYYHVSLQPIGISTTSQELSVTISKKAREVVSITQGS